MNHLALSTTEPVVTITVPVRLIPQLVALIAAAVDADRSRSCVVDTTAETAPSRPGLAKVVPYSEKLRRVGGWR